MKIYRISVLVCLLTMCLVLPVPASASADFMTQAKAFFGNAEAQCNLGVCYEHGDGVPMNKAKAVEWYQKAAWQGYADAQFYVGRFYHLGSDEGGVPKDMAMAVKWYRKAADQGYERAKQDLRKLGIRY